MDMRKLNLLRYRILLLCLVLSIWSCRQVHCPAFPTSEVDWYPYAVDDTIKFAYGNTKLYLLINSYYISDSYSFDSNCDCDCESSMNFKTDIDTINKISFDASIISPKGDFPPFEIEIVIYEYDEYLNRLVPESQDEFYVHETIESNYYDSLEVNGKIFPKVIHLSGVDQNTRFNAIKVAKGVGIIELTQKDSVVWNVMLD